jgi:predicted MFS family arabinose efflux permease
VSSLRKGSLPRSRVLLLAAASGLAVANIFYAQPLLDAIAETFEIEPGSVGLVLTVTQIGYGLGLVLVVPLGDVLDRRRLIVGLMLLSVIALALVAVAWSPALLLLAVGAVGLLAVVAQVLVAYAAALAHPAERGRIVGAVTSGIVVGIIFARTFAGLVTALASWRAVYVASAALTFVLAAIVVRGLPADTRRPTRLRYRSLVGSTLALFRTAPALRVRGTLAMLIFATYSVLWGSLALELSSPSLSLSPFVIGAFGLSGAAGALAAFRAGRLADRGRGERTTGAALTLMLVAWLPLASPQTSLLALIAGLLLLDLALQAVHVTNQSIVYAVDPEARSRLAGAYMAFYAIGIGAGSIASTATYAWAGWSGVCVLGAAISALALGFWAATLPRPSAEPGGVAPSRAARACP